MVYLELSIDFRSSKHKNIRAKIYDVIRFLGKNTGNFIFIFHHDEYIIMLLETFEEIEKYKNVIIALSVTLFLYVSKIIKAFRPVSYEHIFQLKLHFFF